MFNTSHSPPCPSAVEAEHSRPGAKRPASSGSAGMLPRADRATPSVGVRLYLAALDAEEAAAAELSALALTDVAA